MTGHAEQNNVGILKLCDYARAQFCAAIAMRTAVPIDLYCYADFDYTVIAVCCNVLYKTHLITYGSY